MLSTMTNFQSELQPSEDIWLNQFLFQFHRAVREKCVSLGYPPGLAPFVRPANYAVMVNADNLMLVVDSSPIGGGNTVFFADRRSQQANQPNRDLQAAVNSAVKDLGYHQPLGVIIPIRLGTSDELVRATVIGEVLQQVIAALKGIFAVQNLGLPPGYEHFARHMPEFLKDHPEPSRNVFLMMRFKSGEHYDAIHKAIVAGMAKYGLNVVRADDRDYTGDLWDNVCVYMLGCKFGVAVFEEIDLREFNPNVALELGFMMGHGKRCLLVKDQRMPRMPTDVVGKLYKSFDTYNIPETIEKAVDSWAKDMKFTPVA